MGAACTKDTGVIVGGKPHGFDTFDLSELNDDVLLIILSFASYAPFENDSSGTMTLSSIRRGESSFDTETNRLVRDYNESSFKLTKSLRKVTTSRSPFWAPQHYDHEALHGSGGRIARVSSSRTFGTLTHVLPLINKRIHKLCKESNVLWSESLERLLGSRSTQLGSCNLWERGLISYTTSNDDNDAATAEERKETANGADPGAEPNDDESNGSELERARELIIKATKLASRQREQSDQSEALDDSPEDSSAGEVFREVFLHHKQVRLPVYTKCFNASIGKEVTLPFIKPEYKLLIADIMADRSYREKRGFPLSTPRPRFLLACKPNAWREKVACIVEVRRCNLHRDGVADVSVVPISWVLMQDLSPRPESGGLLDATVVQSPKRTRLPVFCMKSRLALGSPVHLQFVEERYKRLIAEVMADRPESERKGPFVTQPRPQFLFVCQTPLKPGNVACVVEVERCRTRSDGTTRVSVVPTCWGLVETLSQRPKSGGLFDAQVLLPGPMFHSG